MKRRTPPAILLAVSLSACSFAPDYHRPAMPVPAALEGGSAGAAQVLAAETDLPSGWQAFIAEPRLRQLVAMAIANNRDLRVALANVDMARAQYRIRRADRFPAVSANGQASLEWLSANTPWGFDQGQGGRLGRWHRREWEPPHRHLFSRGGPQRLGNRSVRAPPQRERGSTAAISCN